MQLKQKKLFIFDLDGTLYLDGVLFPKTLELLEYIKTNKGKYVFSEKIISPFEELILTNGNWDETYVWTGSGDSIFIRDNFGKLVYYESY